MKFMRQTSAEDNGDYIMQFRDENLRYYFFKCNLFTNSCEELTFDEAQPKFFTFNPKQNTPGDTEGGITDAGGLDI